MINLQDLESIANLNDGRQEPICQRQAEATANPIMNVNLLDCSLDELDLLVSQLKVFWQI